MIPQPMGKPGDGGVVFTPVASPIAPEVGVNVEGVEPSPPRVDESRCAAVAPDILGKRRRNQTVSFACQPKAEMSASDTGGSADPRVVPTGAMC